MTASLAAGKTALHDLTPRAISARECNMVRCWIYSLCAFFLCRVQKTINSADRADAGERIVDQ
jgi:hypothetical protein